MLGRHPALAGVDLDVEQGEVVALRGPNRAGKTTLLRLCAGLVALADGHGVVLGCDLARDRVGVRRRVGLLGHESPLYDELDASENVRFWTRAAGVDPAQADDALAQLELDGRLAAVPVTRLSAGQRRRVALAVLVARRPELWLLDEPHAGLDQAGRELLTGSSAGRRPPGPLCSWRHTRASVWPLSEPGSWRWSAERSVPAPGPSGRWPVLADARVVAAKDLRLELPLTGGREPGAAPRPAHPRVVRVRPRSG